MHYSNHISMVSPKGKGINKVNNYFPLALINHHVTQKGLEASNLFAAGGLRLLIQFFFKHRCLK